ncbi:hypothetical protein N7530_006721 [Penicillium desertorum]|uniref:F-box domain-containing protein n=1 Tax=Penicillium desertorum TaxID=1303715 RepID=A0A9W9WS90_9EURO|nr:hypothetical protein N7530_006721 [Penicillium desertorum]
MASLLSTPTKILRIIFAPLSHGDLAAVCLMHRDLQSPAEPFLYAHIQWTWSDSQHPPIAQFLRSIVQKPELATYIHDVVLNGDNFNKGVDDPGNEIPKIPVTELVVNELVELVARINVPYAEEWIQKLRARSMDAFTTLFISQLHNLKRLFLDKNYNRETRLRGMMLRSHSARSPQIAISVLSHILKTCLQILPALTTIFAGKGKLEKHKTPSLSSTYHQSNG